MNKNTIPHRLAHKTISPSELKARFSAWRSARHFGAVAVASLATIKAVSAESDRDTSRRVSALMRERQSAMNDSTATGDEITLSSRLEIATETAPQGLVGSYMLTQSERVQLFREWQPRAKVTAPIAKGDLSDELPPGFVPAPVAPYEPLIDPVYDSVILAQIAAENAFNADVARVSRFLLLMS
jgi:hypothetical protein